MGTPRRHRWPAVVNAMREEAEDLAEDNTTLLKEANAQLRQAVAVLLTTKNIEAAILLITRAQAIQADARANSERIRSLMIQAGNGIEKDPDG